MIVAIVLGLANLKLFGGWDLPRPLLGSGDHLYICRPSCKYLLGPGTQYISHRVGITDDPAVDRGLYHSGPDSGVFCPTLWQRTGSYDVKERYRFSPVS